MRYLLPATSASLHAMASLDGDHFIVDVGELIPVTAVSARSAYFMATAGRDEAPCNGPMVYQIDADGELIAVFD